MGTVIIFILLGVVFFNWMFGDHTFKQVTRSATRQADSSQNPLVPFLLYDMYLDHLEGDQYREDELYAGDLMMMEYFEGDDEDRDDEEYYDDNNDYDDYENRL